MKRRPRSVSSNKKKSIENWYILHEVWQAKEIIYDAHIKHSSHLKVEPTYDEILRAGCRWDNMLIKYQRLLFLMTSLIDKNILTKKKCKSRTY